MTPPLESEMTRLHREAMDALPAVALCAVCPDFRFEGSAAECRERYEAHRVEFHPELVRKKGRRRKGDKSPCARECGRVATITDGPGAGLCRQCRDEDLVAARRVKANGAGDAREALARMDAGEPQVGPGEGAHGVTASEPPVAAVGPAAAGAGNSRPCKTPGCGKPANTRYDRGLFAWLCVDCIEVKRGEASVRATAVRARDKGEPVAPKAPKSQVKPPQPKAELVPVEAAAGSTDLDQQVAALDTAKLCAISKAVTQELLLREEATAAEIIEREGEMRLIRSTLTANADAAEITE